MSSTPACARCNIDQNDALSRRSHQSIISSIPASTISLRFLFISEVNSQWLQKLNCTVSAFITKKRQPPLLSYFFYFLWPLTQESEAQNSRWLCQNQQFHLQVLSKLCTIQNVSKKHKWWRLLLSHTTQWATALTALLWDVWADKGFSVTPVVNSAEMGSELNKDGGPQMTGANCSVHIAQSNGIKILPKLEKKLHTSAKMVQDSLPHLWTRPCGIYQNKKQLEHHQI